MGVVLILETTWNSIQTFTIVPIDLPIDLPSRALQSGK